MYSSYRKIEKEVQPMRIALAVLSAAMIACPIRVLMAQTPADATVPALDVPVSTQLQPALSSVRQATDLTRVDKWKRGNIRDEAAQNISQIQKDIDVTLPPMLRDADTAPASLSKLLPISRNISALYDVLLRVVEASRVVAPDEQVAQLQQALVTLGNARLAFGERMQTASAAIEKQVSDLRASLQAQAEKAAATAKPVAVPCTPAPTHTTTKRKTSSRKPAAGKAGTQPSATKPSASNSNNPKPNPQTH
jgi:hypothetical protein